VIADRQIEHTCTFVRKDSELTGNCTSDRGEGAITGKVEGQKISWTLVMNSEANGQVTLSYRGAADTSKSLSGSVTVEQFGVEGEFIATLAN
jgi:hypothetical protein